MFFSLQQHIHSSCSQSGGLKQNQTCQGFVVTAAERCRTTRHVVLGRVFSEIVLRFISRKDSSHHAAGTDNSRRAKWAPGQWFLWSHYELVRKTERLRSLSVFPSLSLHSHAHALSSTPLIPSFFSPSPHFTSPLQIPPFRPLFCLAHSQSDAVDELLCTGNIKPSQSPHFTCSDLQLLMLFGQHGNSCYQGWAEAL